MSLSWSILLTSLSTLIRIVSVDQIKWLKVLPISRLQWRQLMDDGTPHQKLVNV